MNETKSCDYTAHVLTYRRADPGRPAFAYPIGGDSTLGVVGLLTDLLGGLFGSEFCDEFPVEFVFDSVDGDNDGEIEC